MKIKPSDYVVEQSNRGAFDDRGVEGQIARLQREVDAVVELLDLLGTVEVDAGGFGNSTLVQWVRRK